MVQQQCEVFLRFENVEPCSCLTSNVNGAVRPASHDPICAFEFIGCDLTAMVRVTVANGRGRPIEVELKLSRLQH